jgi:hypothetical protein
LGKWGTGGVGTSIEQSAVLVQVIRQVLESGKTVTLAIKQVVEASEDADYGVPPRPDDQWAH